MSRAEVEGHELGKGEGDRDVVLHRVEQGPEVLPVLPLGVDRKAGRLEGHEVPVNGPRVDVQFRCQLSRGFPFLRVRSVWMIFHCLPS